MSKAVNIVRGFLDALGRRDLAAANKYLGRGFRMTVTGGYVFSSLSEFAAFSRQRHKGVNKSTDKFDEIRKDDSTVVYAIGSMSGTWNDGTMFDGVRFVDRFEIAHGMVVEMRVWSDISEVRSKRTVAR